MGCDEGYFTTFTECKKCDGNNAKRRTNAKTLLCEDGFVLVDGSCVTSTIEPTKNNHVLGCSDGQTAGDTECTRCTDENCVACFPSTTCSICSGRVNENGAYVDTPNAIVMTNNGVVAYDHGFALEDGECVTPSSIVASCKNATAEQCLACDVGVVGSDGSCLECTTLQTGGCPWNNNEFFDGGQCAACGITALCATEVSAWCVRMATRLLVGSAHRFQTQSSRQQQRES